MEKIFIKNRNDQKVAVVVDQTPDQRGLVFVMHGLGGSKDQAHIRVSGSAFKERGFTVVSFDTTNTFGESDGDYADATTTNYYADLEDVIAWASTQPWYAEPFVLVGQSLGGMSSALYAEKHPEKVRALVSISGAVSGKLTSEAPGYKREIPEWKRTGWRETERASRPGTMKRLRWSFMEDFMHYDILPNAALLTMPVLLITGDHDERIPADHQKILFDTLLGPKELHIIPGAPHTLRDPAHLAELKNLLFNWIDAHLV